jgi:hypothetical protein
VRVSTCNNLALSSYSLSNDCGAVLLCMCVPAGLAVHAVGAQGSAAGQCDKQQAVQPPAPTLCTQLVLLAPVDRVHRSGELVNKSVGVREQQGTVKQAGDL